MISICITGQSPTAIAAAQAALEAAGMAPARGLQRDAHINFSTWHDRVYQALEQRQYDQSDDADEGDEGDEGDEASAPASAAIGRLWEQLANDLFLANIDTKVWGWAEAKSLGLLDFWLELDPSIHFVLLASSPEQYLADHLAQLAQQDGARLQDLPVNNLMDQWQQAHQTMLHFALHHPKRCVLLLADELPLQPGTLVEAVKNTWSRKLKALRSGPSADDATAPQAEAQPEGPLLRHFAHELCQGYPQALSLQHEVASVAVALQSQGMDGQALPLIDSLLSTVSKANQAPSLQEQLAALANHQAAQIQAAERTQAEARAQLDEAMRAKTQALANAAQQKDRLKAAEEEGATILAQLHQVQEELERYYLRNTELEAQLAQQEEIDAAVHARNLLAIARNEEAQAKAQALEQLGALGQQYQALCVELEAATQAKLAAVHEVDTLTHARNQAAIERLEERAQFEVLDQQNQALVAQLEAQAQSKAAVIDELATLARQNEVLSSQLDEEAQAKAQALEELNALGQQYQALCVELEAATQAKLAAVHEVDTLTHARNQAAIARLEERAQFEDLDQRNRTQLDALGQQYQALCVELEAATQAKLAAVQEVDTLTHARNLAAITRLEERAQFEALDQQNQALVVELEAQAQSKAAVIDELGTLTRQIEDLSNQLDDERQAKQDALDAVDAVVHQRNLASVAHEEERAQAATAKEEYAYLLGQLQQVQEELERCYLRSKDLETIATQTAQRFSRVVLREPDGIDWESVQTTVVPGPGGAQLRCQATQVAVAGKVWDALEFTAHLHQGALAFTFSRSLEAPGPLTRWPRAAASANQWTATVDPAASSSLKEVSTSDWDLLHGLPKLLTQGLKQDKGPWPQGAPVVQDWLEAARATLPALQRQPLAVRIDTLRLQANRVLAGREYLVLCAEQLTLAQKRFAALEFRLGCNLGPKGEFGQTARLEFFKGTPPLFDNWAPNVQDPSGDRLDLVFVFPGSMNLKDWAALSTNDRSLVLLLADQLPGLLSDLQTGAQRMSRPLDDWIALANTLRSFVRERLDVTGLQKTGPQTRAKSLPAQTIASAKPARKRSVRATPPTVATPAAPKRAARAPAAPTAPPTARKGRKK